MNKLANEKIGQFAQRVMLSTELKNAAILELIHQEFPEAKTTAACIAWYRSDLKKKPKLVVVPEVTLETIEAEILEAQARVTELYGKKEAFLEENAEKIAARKAALRAELEALEAMSE
jgi:hypothetical protein